MSTEPGTSEPDAAERAALGAALAEPVCVFCDRIERGEYDDEPRRGCYVFPPLNPVTPGHLLVVPGEHVRDAAVAPATAAAVMQQAALLVQRAGGDANIITSIGPAATQSVPHLHVHVVPRHEGDGLALPWTGQRIREEIDPAKLDLLADWMDQDDATHGRTSFPEVQADLRHWAKLLRSAS